MSAACYCSLKSLRRPKFHGGIRRQVQRDVTSNCQRGCAAFAASAWLVAVTCTVAGDGMSAGAG